MKFVFFMYKEDTIAAIATPVGEGGVAIIRVSGTDAERLATTVFVRSQGKNGKLRSHTLYHGTIRNPHAGNALDEVLLTVMRKPRSYTGEDVVEIHCHGGVLVVRQVLGLLLSQGARHAEPGEFTKRAFLNGRFDLSQAEAVLDLIRARTGKGAELALSQIDGKVSKWVHELREELLQILVQVEAAIDFPEEDIELLQRQELTVKVDGLRKKIHAISATYEWGKLFRDGARVCICGRPNVGKSSLLNALLGEERVIVTPIPGTTRDVIEETLNLDGLPIVLWDTAGIRDTDEQIEKIGVDLSRHHLEKADVVIVVLDGSSSLTTEDRSILKAIEKKKSLIAINKIDLPQALNAHELECTGGGRTISFVSAKTESGLHELKQALRNTVLGSDREPPVVVTNLRHNSALVRSETTLARAVAALNENCPSELIAVDLNEAREALEEIVGIINTEDILERIFEHFCIGK